MAMLTFIKRGSSKQSEIVREIPETHGLKNPKSAIRNPPSKVVFPSWYINRLRLMPLPEIGLRLYRKIRVKIWKLFLRMALTRNIFSFQVLTKHPGDWLAEIHDNFPIHLDESFRERYDRFFSIQQVIDEAEDLVQGKIPIFERVYNTGGEIPDWHRDVLSPVSWPKIFVDQLNHNDLRYGRINNVWELNRHYYFYDLGKAYYLTGDQRYAKTLIAHLESWIDQNPIGIGINWFSPMDHGLRLVSWFWGLFFISGSLGSSHDLSFLMTFETGQKILTSIYWQAFFIEKNLSKYSSANNHLVGEALGLFWVGTLLPFLRRAKIWKKRGWSILCQEIEKQIFPDGVSREQSTRYLFFLFDLYTLAIVLAQKEKLPIPSALWNRLEKVCEFIMALMDDGGHLPELGDSSNGLGCKLHSTPLHPYRSLLTTGAIWFERGDFKHWGGKIDERNFWLWGDEGLSQYQKLEEDPSEMGSRIFPQGGQIILRKGRGTEESVLSFDAGPFGFLSIAAHAHADALSFTLSIGGIPIFIDPGTYLYHDGGKWRKYFRGTQAHNTIEVDGRDQAVSGGAFMWLTKPETVIRKISMDQDRAFVQAVHTGYQHLTVPLIHDRSILWDSQKQSWSLEDRLETQGPHHIRQAFHFHPCCRVQSVGPGIFEITLDIETPILFLKLDSRLKTSLHWGEEDPIRGWYSDSFGKKVPTFSLLGEMNIKKTEIIETLFWRALDS